MNIEVSNLSFSYGNQLVLNNINFVAGENQLLSVLGANGAGKSTLFRCILGLLKGYKGQILLNDMNIKKLSIEEIARLVAYIPQSHYPSFNFSVFDMVLMGTTIQVSSVSSPGKKQLRLVEEALEKLGIYHLKNRSYTRISGGERQLVLMARALVQQAKILILDEPTANLDYGNQIRVLAQIRSLAGEGYTIIQSTHNPEQSFMFSDNIMVIKAGRILALGKPCDIFTEELIQSLYGIEVRIQNLYNDRARVCIPNSIIKKDCC